MVLCLFVQSSVVPPHGVGGVLLNFSKQKNVFLFRAPHGSTFSPTMGGGGASDFQKAKSALSEPPIVLLFLSQKVVGAACDFQKAKVLFPSPILVGGGPKPCLDPKPPRSPRQRAINRFIDNRRKPCNNHGGGGQEVHPYLELPSM